MRKEKMITRTITQTSAQVMAIDVTNSEVSIFETKIGGVYTDIELLKMLKRYTKQIPINWLALNQISTRKFY